MERELRAAALIGVAVVLTARADEGAPPQDRQAAFADIQARVQAVQAEKDEAARGRLLDELQVRTRAFLDAHREAASGEQLTLAAAAWLQVAALKDDWAGVEREVAALRALPALPGPLQAFLAELEPTIPGRPAPAWTAQDIHTGEAVTLESLRGKLVLVNFWATWCPPCRSLMQQRLQPLHQAYVTRGEEFQLVGLGLPRRGETAQKEVEYCERQGYHWRKLFDPSGEAGRSYHVEGIPYLALIDPEGKILVAGSGWAVIGKVERLLAERLGPAPAPPEEKKE